MADRVPLDFDPPVRQIRALLLGVDNRDLTMPTPCPDWPVATLLDHLMGRTLAFTLAARKRAGAEPSVAGLSAQWRSRLPVLLADLAIAWKDPAAWTGTAQVGGVIMPATAMGTVAMNELVVHGWDLARATGQAYEVDVSLLPAVAEFLDSMGDMGRRMGAFGPVVAAPAGADRFGQLIAATGRDPGWESR